MLALMVFVLTVATGLSSIAIYRAVRELERQQRRFQTHALERLEQLRALMNADNAGITRELHNISVRLAAESITRRKNP